MKLSNKLLIIFVSIVITSISCSKEEDNTENVKQILTKGSWYTESINLNVSMSLGTQQYKMQTCQEDDTTIFYQDGKMKQFQGATICDGFDYIAIEGIWQVSDQGKSLLIAIEDISEIKIKFDLKEISDKRVYLTIDYSGKNNGNDYSISGEIKFYKK
jgi:hypothetical protein